MKALGWIVRIVIFLFLFFFALQNTERVTIQFFEFKSRAPLVLLLLIFFACGVVVGVAACLPRLFKRRREEALPLPVASSAPVISAEPSPPSAPTTPPTALPANV